ncbi:MULTISPECIES: hypothetical protein [unclassified Frondihabitans]|uniref:hypothetical protein n=1 Tax=unclassified Frondihabitans TaxID=2626248 RepID=UPI000F4DA30F|nr:MULTISPECIES: hypothetical protein [unclassified Frondihabitans]RPE73739.1 hypothetical protein EDF37_3436 [Frondihabitans sp. PhB153]RPF02124.1 hypothetical protein EDF39_3445 [Frondihabitans sp. PhB161]
MTDTSSGPRPVVVTLDVTDDDVYAVLVNSLREAADRGAWDAEREGEMTNPNDDWAEDQERKAQIARELAANIETQVDALSTAPKKEQS